MPDAKGLTVTLFYFINLLLGKSYIFFKKFTNESILGKKRTCNIRPVDRLDFTINQTLNTIVDTNRIVAWNSF